ncbi:PD-(D/E)XK nuclease family protein [candidate division KSB1 bacterium]|nr:PD-(D/E)XK nuclease family protein [candidate division KSB1 bacterium]
MKEIAYRFYSFREPIVPLAVQEYARNKTVFVFPTGINKHQAIQTLQRFWSFDDLQIFTMDEFKEHLFYRAQPLIKEEKRTIAFYLSLDDEARRFFKINSYFQSIELAQNFFALWEEFNEERVAETIDPDFFERNGIELVNWQKETFQQLQRIRANYRILLDEHGFQDQIFFSDPRFYDLADLDAYNRFIFVNQFYYTRLEKWIIDQLSRAEKEVHILYQILPSLVDIEQLEVKPFSLPDLLSDQPLPDLQIIRSLDSFSMLVSFLQLLKRESIQTVVDVDFCNKPYAYYLSAQSFKLRTTQRFLQTSLYRIFDLLHTLLRQAIHDATKNRWLLPLDVVLQAVLADDLFRYFAIRTGAQEIAALQERCSHTVLRWIDAEYRLIDIRPEKLNLGGLEDQDVRSWFDALLVTVDRLSRISSITALVDLIDKKEGLDIHAMIHPADLDSTDLLDSFYRMLSDFAAIEAFPLVQSWTDFWSLGGAPTTQSLQTAMNILRLFLEYMKAKQIHLFEKQPFETPVRLTDLLDTRNMSYSSVALLNLVEGSLPHGRKSPYLFTDPQRKLLNLKTFEEVKQREKYYFFRLLFSSARVYLFTCANQEQNIEMSSFVEEILLDFPKAKLNQAPGHCFGVVHAGISKPAFPRHRYRPPQEPDFFYLPYRDDFSRELYLSYTRFDALKTNAFAYYLRYMCGIQKLPKTLEMDYSSRLIGNIVHDAMNEYWQSLSANKNQLQLESTDFDEKKWNQALQAVMSERADYDLKLPHNYTNIYFQQILLPLIAENFSRFASFMLKKWRGRSLMVFPEKKWETGPDKLLMTPEQNDLFCQVWIHGRADLRLHDAEERTFQILDYKTGKSDSLQLDWYEWYYYLLDCSDWMNRVESAFVNLTESEEKPIVFINPRSGTGEGVMVIRRHLQKVLKKIADTGFGPPPQISHAKENVEISRADLLTPQIRQQAEARSAGGDHVECH